MSNGEVKLLALDDLLLDMNNPRLGGHQEYRDQASLLDYIINKFEIDDVLSSIAANGYISAEPLVCREEKSGKYIVVEGNRRLCACLVLGNDHRARNHPELIARYRKIWKESGSKSFNPVPVIVFDDQNSETLLPYLGVRHIVSAQPWDSYAKAAWVANIVETQSVDVEAVSQMIGDSNRTIVRLLEGYYFMRQVIEAGAFRPEDSVRSGRGSVTHYPFSWVYTLLGYKAARDFLDLPERSVNPNPVKRERLREAKIAVTALFGDRSAGKNSALADSREISRLAEVLADPDKVFLLEAGKSVAEIDLLTRPISERLRDGLNEVRLRQRELLVGVTENTIEPELAKASIKLASSNASVARQIEAQLTRIAEGE